MRHRTTRLHNINQRTRFVSIEREIKFKRKNFLDLSRRLISFWAKEPNRLCEHEISAALVFSARAINKTM